MVVINEHVRDINAEQMKAAYTQATVMNKEAIEQIKNFKPENDLKLIHYLEKQLECQLTEAKEFKLKKPNSNEPKTPSSAGRTRGNSIGLSLL